MLVKLQSSDDLYRKLLTLLINIPMLYIVFHKPSEPFPTSQYEHSSIPATIKKIFNLPEFLTKRDAWAGTLEGLLTRSSPRTDCPGKISIFGLPVFLPLRFFYYYFLGFC